MVQGTQVKIVCNLCKIDFKTNELFYHTAILLNKDSKKVLDLSSILSELLKPIIIAWKEINFMDGMATGMSWYVQYKQSTNLERRD